MILQDHLKGRRTEIDFINGIIVKKGRETKVPTPWNEAVISVSKRIEKGTLKPGFSNKTVLEQAWQEASKGS